MTAEAFSGIDSLPGKARALLCGPDFMATEAWFSLVIRHALPPAAAPLFLVCRDPWAVLPLRRDGRVIGGLTTPYTARFAPLGAPGMTADGWRTTGDAMGRWLRRSPVTRLDCIDAADPCLAGFTEGLRAAGLAVRRFDHFGNWHDDVCGLDWAYYLARRPGALRETLRRKGRKAAHLRFEVVTAATPECVRAYEAVYARSWKTPEPFPDFPTALSQAAGAIGALRLGVCWDGETPLAAQIWVVHARQASVHKLAHDETRKADSPGTLLTAAVLKPLLDAGDIDEVDFGRGDDGYKRGWAALRRQRIGFEVFNPATPRGIAALGRNTFARAIRRLTPSV